MVFMLYFRSPPQVCMPESMAEQCTKDPPLNYCYGEEQARVPTWPIPISPTAILTDSKSTTAARQPIVIYATLSFGELSVPGSDVR